MHRYLTIIEVLAVIGVAKLLAFAAMKPHMLLEVAYIHTVPAKPSPGIAARCRIKNAASNVAPASTCTPLGNAYWARIASRALPSSLLRLVSLQSWPRLAFTPRQRAAKSFHAPLRPRNGSKVAKCLVWRFLTCLNGVTTGSLSLAPVRRN